MYNRECAIFIYNSKGNIMQSSNLECRIHDILEEAGVDYAEEWTFPDLQSSNGKFLRFDFCVFTDDGEIDFLIEAQGIQHYRAVKHFGGSRGLHRQRYNDDLKRRYCMAKRLNLIHIPYWDENKLNYEYIMRAAGYM